VRHAACWTEEQATTMATQTTLKDFIATHRGDIVARTAALLGQRCPDLPEDARMGALPVVLDEIIAGLDRCDDAEIPRVLMFGRSDAGARQGVHRHHTGVAIDVVVRCFGAVCDSVTALADAEGLVFAAGEMRILNLTLDNAIATAISEYSALDRRAANAVAAERIGALAHELRNAVAAATYAFAVIREGRVGVTSSTANILARSLARMEALIAQTLAAARLQSGVQLAPERANLARVLRDLLATQPQGHAPVSVDVPDDLTVDADATLLASAVSNLLQNALKYTRGGVWVRARAEGDDVVIEVEDECGGLPVADPRTLFDAFERHDPARRGAGLGLTIARDAVKAHGGTIEARDLAPRGCVFALKWPRRPRAPS
jgi:hypothetical protein